MQGEVKLPTPAWHERRCYVEESPITDDSMQLVPLFTADQLRQAVQEAVEAERERCARICDEMGEHWSAYKDTALLNGDVELSNAASGEPRAAETLARLIRGGAAAIRNGEGSGQ